jgi:16S rRNA (uracil1498-N3)-methyltransferase
MIFYAPGISGSRYELSEEESAHAMRVLRLKTDDAVTLTDGRGGWYVARIVATRCKRCEVEILERQPEFGKRRYRLHIGIAPTKNIDRFEWFVEKATEIGVDEITPLLCEHSERKHVNIERLLRILIAAMKQSKKAYLPHINRMTDFGRWLETQNCGQRFIAHCNSENRRLLKTAYSAGQDAVIAIGPEGDFSEREVAQAFACGFAGVSLGASRLRTETAGVAACYSMYFINSE